MAVPLCLWHSHTLTLRLLSHRTGNKPDIQPCHQKLHLFHSNTPANMWEKGHGKCKMGTHGKACPGRDTNNSNRASALVLPDLLQSLLTSKGAFLAGSEQFGIIPCQHLLFPSEWNGWTSRTITQLPVQQVGSCELHPSFAQPDQPRGAQLTNSHVKYIHLVFKYKHMHRLF